MIQYSCSPSTPASIYAYIQSILNNCRFRYRIHPCNIHYVGDILLTCKTSFICEVFSKWKPQ